MTVYSENNVPILFRGPGERIGLSPEMYDTVQKAHEAAQDALQKASAAVHAASGDVESDDYAKARDAQSVVLAKHLLLGESVVMDNVDPDRTDLTFHGIGSADLKEALQDVIGGFDRGHIGPDDQSSDHVLTPRWVASTHEGLAAALADYYSCDVRPISEVI